MTSEPTSPEFPQVFEDARLAWLSGQDDHAENLLMSVRHRATIEKNKRNAVRSEIMLALFTLATDDEARSSSHLSAARDGVNDDTPSWQARFWIAQSRLLRRTDIDSRVGPAPKLSHLNGDDQIRNIAVELLVERAIWARLRKNLDEAKHLITQALETARETDPCAGAVWLEKSHLEISHMRWSEAQHAAEKAIGIYERLGCPREQGRAMMSYAVDVCPNLSQSNAAEPARILGEAKTVMGQTATWRDASALRTGFRAWGRRIQDQAVGANVAAHIDDLERESGQLTGNIAAAVDRADRRLGRAVGQLGALDDNQQGGFDETRHDLMAIREVVTSRSQELIRMGRRLAEVIEAAVVERHRIRKLVDMLAEIDANTDPAALGESAANMAARFLDADRVVIARRTSNDELDVIGKCERFLGDTEPTNWRDIVQKCFLKPSAVPQNQDEPRTREEGSPQGPVLVAPMRGREFYGAIYADKLKRKGQFSDQDVQLTELFSDFVALAYSRLVAIRSKRLAFEQLSTTLDTIRDGVISVDAAGTVTSFNSAAARMLKVDADKILGQSLESAPELRPLVQILISSLRVDSALIKLGHGSFVVTARPIRSERRPRGVVATLVELDRAQRMAQRVTATRPRYLFADIVGNSPTLKTAIHMARQASSVSGTVLITGESGTGKEVFAQAVHTGGPRSSEMFVGVNCAAVPRELLEAELFGYERGAFTGARTEGNAGKFELAGHGTLLLDEIGDMPLDMQAKLLRVLQERVVVRLGGAQERHVEARVIATTHRDLDVWVEAGRFRHDLLYRLRVLHVHLPPLRDRGDDVIMLAWSFLQRYAREQGKQVRGFTPEVERALMEYAWPGNVRQLANVIEREVSLLDANSQTLSVLQSSLEGASPSLEPPPVVRAAIDETPGRIIPLAEVEKRAYLRALDLSARSVPKAASALGVSKVTFYSKLRSWGMHPKDRN